MDDEKTGGGVALGTASMAGDGTEETVELTVLPIYNAYKKEIGNYRTDLIRLTFLEIQYRLGCALTWPDVK